MKNAVKIIAIATGFAIFGLATQSNAAATLMDLVDGGLSSSQYFILGGGLIGVRMIGSRTLRVKN